VSPLWLVDTSAWIFALRRAPSPVIVRRIAELLESDTVATCGVVQLELLGGAANEAEYTRLEQRLRGLRYLPIESPDWEDAARLALQLRRAGITVPFTDALLSALAVKHQAILLHADRDFDLIATRAPLQVESLADALDPGSAS
jgi:predicted nucleic acid-binding protein